MPPSRVSVTERGVPEQSAEELHPDKDLTLDGKLAKGTGWDEPSPGKVARREDEVGRFAEVARACHAMRPEVPMILMTGYNPSLDPEELREEGIVAILLKPYTIQSFGKAVAEAIAVNKGK